MLTKILRSWMMRSLAFASGLAFLCSFSGGLGGDSFKVYLGDKLLTEQYLTSKFNAPTITIQEATKNDMVKVHFNECGQIGIKRTLSLRDGSKLLKSWSFDDASANNPGAWMTIKADEIKAFQKNAALLKLVYASKHIDKGVSLVSISSQPSTASVGR